ncbi:GGDEF domain-containing phosphodiesterase [Virgisporangium aurantiacum]|uniref:PAS domain S-box-containing protein/diguanylate cyclase (GGDEF) domain-containing protein n=1 Tax=Virgisporangium aurantiacum TaxID=175570 RepID=A0A8J3Z1W5_9ACTN|nr:GGDEF domain-containing phosphodiesterase [Virgisporangium aurantiacum]GIJ55067.1 hypothetical protein Vau01_025830 [Virgisporangium aurantiacum]
MALRLAIGFGLVAVVLVGLAVTRMWRVAAAGLRRSLARERELRRGCEALLSATDVEAVRVVVGGAVAGLLPPGTAHEVTLVLGDGALPASDSAATMIVAETRHLPADISARLPGHDLALHCRLSVGERQLGRLYVAADGTALVELQQAMPVLAGQAAGAIDRLRLTGELGELGHELGRELARRDAEAHFRTLVVNAADAILIVDDDGRVRYGSPSATDLLGPDDPTGRPVQDLFEHGDAVLAAVRARVGTVAGWTRLRPTGERIEVEAAIRDLRHEPTVDGIVLTLRDITERRRRQRELEERAYLDPLTGLGSRLLFEDELERAAAAPTVTGVLLVGVDATPTDELLRAVGERLRACLDGRTVARLGADEFGVVVENAGDEIDGLADSILGRVPGRVSIGAATTATTDADADGPGQLLDRAGVALRTARSQGGGRRRRYDAALHREIAERTRLRDDLRQALADGHLALRYQPIVDLGSGRAVGLGSRVCWTHPERGPVPPDVVTELAEESGLTAALGSWVLDRSIRDAVGWQCRFPSDPPRVSVTVPAGQFRTPGFVEHVLTLINRHGLEPYLLTLEITESLLLAGPAEVRGDLSILRNAGLRIAVGDFGTLSCLYDVDVLTLSTADPGLVAGVVRLARTLRLDVVADGTEPPMPSDEVLPWLTADVGTAELSGARS